MQQFDVIVIGAGHAGAEAAHAAWRLGCSVALFSLDLNTMGRMPCSPSIGGLAKSHLVKEIDALGGLMAEVADETAIQYRILNTRKGPAVRATRTQNDRHRYEAAIRRRLEQSGIHLMEARACRLVTEDGRISGVIDQEGAFTAAPTVVITAGTFLAGLVHVGPKHWAAGRTDEDAAYELAASLKELGLVTGRHKTGTPPRLHADSLDYARMQRQEPLDQCPPFAFTSGAPALPQRPCHLTRTSPDSHALIHDHITLSPLYSGAITGTPARYCPSLEDKVMRFGDRNGHQIIIEPEGLDSPAMYASGLGNSLPVEIQERLVHSVPGLEEARILKFGYAIEYDYVLPTQLERTLECRTVPGLFLAGQVNGTSGYEEAAAQGLLAGINAALTVQGRPCWIPDRSLAYLGVMVDDLTTKGTSEPYRMFTSRAEYRLMLRETNALLRLNDTAHHLGLIDDERFRRVQAVKEELQMLRDHMHNTLIAVGEVLPDAANPDERLPLERLLKRPEVHARDLNLPPAHFLALAEAEIEIKYAGYIERQLLDIKRFREMEACPLPEDIDYANIPGLSTELRDRLTSVRPRTLGQASRIEGMTPAALQAIRIDLRSSGPAPRRESPPAA